MAEFYKPLATIGASVRLHVGMDFYVLDETVLGVVYLSAHLANVDDCLKVLRDVFYDQMLLAIAPAADWARVSLLAVHI